jgi:hypothetical protein
VSFETCGKTIKRGITKSIRIRAGGQGPPMSALRGAGLGGFVVVIWTKNLLFRSGQEEAGKKLKNMKNNKY